MPIYLALMVASKVTGSELPTFEEFMGEEVKHTKRTAEEIENDFESIIQKARETEHGEYI